MSGRYDPGKRLSEVIVEVLKSDNLGVKLLENRAVSLWKVVLGPTVNRHTKHVALHDGIMHVELTSSVVRQELLMMKQQIIDALNKATGQDIIRDIHFR